jgi:hypothetical protein
MFVLLAQGRKGGRFLAGVCATKQEALAIAARIGGLKIVGPFASIMIPHARWRLCKATKTDAHNPARADKDELDRAALEALLGGTLRP